MTLPPARPRSRPMQMHWRPSWGVRVHRAEAYLAHQQGVGGATSHITNPDRPAWESMYATAEGQQKGAGVGQASYLGQHDPGDEGSLRQRGQRYLGRLRQRMECPLCRHQAVAGALFSSGRRSVASSDSGGSSTTDGFAACVFVYSVGWHGTKHCSRRTAAGPRFRLPNQYFTVPTADPASMGPAI